VTLFWPILDPPSPCVIWWHRNGPPPPRCVVTNYFWQLKGLKKPEMSSKTVKKSFLPKKNVTWNFWKHPPPPCVFLWHSRPGPPPPKKKVSRIIWMAPKCLQNYTKSWTFRHYRGYQHNFEFEKKNQTFTPLDFATQHSKKMAKMNLESKSV
jgi:hypothetical protein